MNINTDDRCVLLGRYIAEHRATVRTTAKVFGISKSTVHKDVSENLKKVNPQLYKQVKKILEINKQETTTTKANAAKTGDFAPIAGITTIAIAGMTLILSRKKK